MLLDLLVYYIVTRYDLGTIQSLQLFVLGFLFKFEQASEATKMTAKNLAIVFAPTT